MKKIVNSFFDSLKQEKIKETFSVYEASFNCEDIVHFSRKLTEANYNQLNEIYTTFGCKWDLYIEDYSYSISQDDFKELKGLEEDDLKTTIIFRVHKCEDKIPIIDIDKFSDFLTSITLEKILSIFQDLSFPIELIGDGYDISLGSTIEREVLLSKRCNFRSYAQYHFYPEDFYQEETSKKEIPTSFEEVLSKLTLIYTLIFIFDSSEINDNKIELVISGNKTIKYTLDFHSLNTKSLEEYFKIYKWIYSEKNRVEDKIGLSRNVLTAYLHEKNIEIDNSVFTSILSSFQIYIKGNISKYFEVKNEIIKQIEQTVNDVNKSIESFITNFQKSSFVFVSFFLSVFIFKVVNKSELDEIFTKETSLIGIGFIIVSFLYLIASRIIIFMESDRLEKRYNNVKKRYEDVLVKDDIEKILNKDFEYESEKTHLKNRIFIYTIVWFLSLLVFTVALFLASDYLISMSEKWLPYYNVR